MTHTQVQPDLTVERARVLVKFGEAWSGKNLDALMSLVTDDCTYAASVGPEPGETFIGRDAVRGGFAALMAYDAGGESREGRVAVLGELGLAEWAYERRDASGRTIVVRGCDIFEFTGTLIRRKDAFRKCYPRNL
jgi:ketosteroid isomerase-like protein